MALRVRFFSSFYYEEKDDQKMIYFHVNINHATTCQMS